MPATARGSRSSGGATRRTAATATSTRSIPTGGAASSPPARRSRSSPRRSAAQPRNRTSPTGRVCRMPAPVRSTLCVPRRRNKGVRSRAMQWITSFKIGARVYLLLKQRYPEILAKVPDEDLVAVVEELITSMSTIQQTTLVDERGAGGSPRLVVRDVTPEPPAPEPAKPTPAAPPTTSSSSRGGPSTRG